MRTTIDLPEGLLDDVLRATGATTRREALVAVLEDFLRQQRLRRVAEAAGGLDLDLDVRALRAAGEDRLDG
jgi:Arc/MetJ family transcription regulator